MTKTEPVTKYDPLTGMGACITRVCNINMCDVHKLIEQLNSVHGGWKVDCVAWTYRSEYFKTTIYYDLHQTKRRVHQMQITWP